MVAPKYPTYEELSKIFKYVDGILYRKTKRTRRSAKDRLVVNKHNHSSGYCRIKFNGKRAMYHQIVWILNYGDIPSNYVIDHINGDKLDNRLCNLRLVTTRENGQNRVEHRNGKLVGANYLSRLNKWQANIQIKGEQIYLGIFDTEQEAHQAYLLAIREPEE